MERTIRKPGDRTECDRFTLSGERERVGVRRRTRLASVSSAKGSPLLFMMTVHVWVGIWNGLAHAEPPERTPLGAAARRLSDDAPPPDADSGAGEVVVHGESEETTVRHAGSVSVIEVDESVSATADVASVVDGAAGTTVIQLGGLGDFSAVSLRGSSLRQVQVHLDGVPLNPDGGEVVNLSELPLGAFSRIEVWRSAPPPELMAAPIGGVVNLVTLESSKAARLGVTAGSFGTARFGASGAGQSSVGGIPVDGLVFADLFRTQGDFPYFADQGTVYNLLDDRRLNRSNNDKSQLSSQVRLRLGEGGRRLTLLDTFLQREEGLPGHSNDPATAARLSTQRNLAVAQLDASGDLLTGWGRFWAITRSEELDDRLGEIGVARSSQLTQTASFGLASHVGAGFSNWLIPSLTTSARLDRVEIEDRLAGSSSPPRYRAAATAAASVDVLAASETVVVSPVVFAQHQRFLLGANDATSTSDAELWRADPRLGIRWTVSRELTLKSSGGRYLRAPDFTELFGDRGAMVGNPALRPESGWLGDVGAVASLNRWSWCALRIEAGSFFRRSEDLIVWTQNSQRTMVPINVGAASVGGTELGGTAVLWDRLELDASVTQTVSKNLVSRSAVYGNQLPRIPPAEVWLGTAWHHREIVRLGHGLSYTAPNYWDATNYFRSPARLLHDVFARVRPGGGVEVEASVRNLTDARVQVVDRDPLQPQSDARRVQALTDFLGYPLAGRTLLFTLRWTP